MSNLERDLLHQTYDKCTSRQTEYSTYNQNMRIYQNQTLFDGEGNGTPLQYSCLENPMGRGAWWAAIRGVAKSWTRLSDFTFTFHFHALEKEMATHSSVLAWRIQEMAEPGRRPPMGSHRVGHNWSDLAVADTLWLLSLAWMIKCSSSLEAESHSCFTIAWNVM